MAILYRYLKNYWQLVAVALVLATVNRVFCLLDPLIFRHIIDSYATRYREYSSPQFVKGHEELLAKRGLYYAMWRQQVGEGRVSVTTPA